MHRNKKLDHTLIIRTRNRTKWLNYTLYQYTKHRYSGIVQIEDDSEEEYFLSNSKIISKYNKELTIKHERGAGIGEKTRAARVAKTSKKCFEKIVY